MRLAILATLATFNAATAAMYPAPYAADVSTPAKRLELTERLWAHDFSTDVRLWPAERLKPEAVEKPLRFTENELHQSNLVIGDILNPQFSFFPAKGESPRPAVVVFPGGGYRVLGWNKEGTEVAKWFNAQGFSAFVLLYRTNDRDGALADAQRTMGIIRRDAAKYGVAPKRLGVIGFSAGANLAVRLSTNWRERRYAHVDEADDFSCRPDFMMPIYPWDLRPRKNPATPGEGWEKTLEMLPDYPVDSETPPSFTVQAKDDFCEIETALALDQALRKAGVPSTVRIYPDGGHGYGLRRLGKSTDAWSDEAAVWLAQFKPALSRVKENFIRVLKSSDPQLCAEIAAAGKIYDNGDFNVRFVRNIVPESSDEIEALICSQNHDGSWPDVDYVSVTRSVWPAVAHLDKMKTLARAPRTERTVEAFHLALGFWLGRHLRNPNWWWNEIGVPLALGASALMMDDSLSAEERALVVAAMRQCKIGMTGQNRVWISECVLMRALLEGNEADFAAARDAIAGEISISGTEEGIQDDWSFHQHGNMAQFGNYGASYIMTVSQIACVFAGTGFDLPEEKFAILEDLVDRGFRPVVWRGAMDVGSLGRQLTPGAMRTKGLAPLVAARWLAESGREKPKRIFRDLLADMHGEKAEVPRTGLCWFPKSAMGMYRSGGWMAAVKCSTASIKGSERVNEDNRLGAHLADGALFTYVTGDEYRDVFPLWNWRHIPGTTSYDMENVDWDNRNLADKCEAKGNKVEFVLDRAGLKATTRWTFSDYGVDVDVSGISSTGDQPVVTTVEQSVAQPNATWRHEDGGVVAVNGPILYELPSNAVVRIEERTGSWRRNMGALSGELVKGRVFEIVIPHGVRPGENRCSWRVRPQCRLFREDRRHCGEAVGAEDFRPTGELQEKAQALADLAVKEGMQGALQFCAYKDGKCIVDVWAGTMTTNAGAAKIDGDTLFPIFSTEKPLLATAVHRNVERGKLEYDQPVCKYWPEFRGGGKENLTVREMMGYRSGLPDCKPGTGWNDFATMSDWKGMLEWYASCEPQIEPGTKQRYMPKSYGWALGGLLEKAWGRPANDILREQVLIPAGIEKDFYFVCGDDEIPRIATVYHGSAFESMNNDIARRSLLPSAWAVSSARGIAKFYNRLCGFDGQPPLIRKSTLDAALMPCRHESDPLPDAEGLKKWHMIFGMGYGLWGEADDISRVFGHGGVGGSEGLCDRSQRLVIGYTCNFDNAPPKLREAFYSLVGMRWRYWKDDVNIQDLQMATVAKGNAASANSVARCWGRSIQIEGNKRD